MADTREPSPRSRQVFKGGKKEKNKNDKTKTPGQLLEESGDYLQDPETEDLSKGSLMIKTGPDYAKDAKENKKLDDALDPDKNFQKGIYKKPSLEQLRAGRDIWKDQTAHRFRQMLAIGAAGTAIVTEGLKQLLIPKPMGF